MTELTPVFIALSVITILVNLLCVRYTGGVRNNVFNLFLLSTFAFYLLLTPSVYYFTHNVYAVNVDVYDYFGVGHLQIALHFILYTIGYFLLVRHGSDGRVYVGLVTRSGYRAKIERRIVVIFATLFAVIFVNTLVAGINLADVILGNYGEPTLGLQGGSYYLQNLADSLITLLAAAYYFRIRRRFFLVMLLVAIPLFLVLGFRYRVLLTVFGICMVYFYDHGIRASAIVKYVLALSVFFYALMLLTYNRTSIFMQQYDKISFDYSEFPYDAVFDQAKGSLIDFALYKAVATRRVDIDHGTTMIGYIFVKMAPEIFFPNHHKPYPPPQMLAIDESIGAGREVGEAVTCLGGAFMAFWYPGIYVCSFLLGAVTARMQNQVGRDMFGILIGLAVMLSLFQWVTRGYFPQLIDHLAYMLFPILLLRYLSRRAEAPSVA